MTDWVDCTGGARAEWVNTALNFDSLPVALLSSILMMTADGWSVLMDSTLDANAVTGKVGAPMNKSYPVAAFILFHMVCSFGIRQLFLAVTYDRLKTVQQRMEAREGGAGLFRSTSLLSPLQVKWVESVMRTVHLAPHKKKKHPAGLIRGVRLSLFNVTMRKSFNYAVALVACTHLWLLSTISFEQSDSWIFIQRTGEMACSVFFCVVVWAQLIGSTPMFYFSIPINWANFVLCNIGMASAIYRLSTTSYQASASWFLLLMRTFSSIVHVIVEGGVGTHLRQLLLLFAVSIPSILTVCFLLFGVVAMYAVIGQAWFYNVKGHTGINEYENFHDWMSSVVVLLGCVTGENWGEIMQVDL